MARSSPPPTRMLYWDYAAAPGITDCSGSMPGNISCIPGRPKFDGEAGQPESFSDSKLPSRAFTAVGLVAQRFLLRTCDAAIQRRSHLGFNRDHYQHVLVPRASKRRLLLGYKAAGQIVSAPAGCGQ